MNFPRKRQTVTGILSVSLLLFALFPAPLAASMLTLAWDPNTEDDLAGYKVYYGTQSGDYDSVADIGNVSQYTVRGLEPETRYYFALTAYNVSGYESDFSAEVSAITDNEPVSSASSIASGGGSGGGCFIATAAYGSYLNPHVKIFRDFRDEFLIPNSLGRKFVYAYYQYGPRIADHMEKNGSLQFLTRQALFPMIGISSLSLRTTTSPTLLLLPLLIPLIFILLFRSYRRPAR